MPHENSKGPPAPQATHHLHAADLIVTGAATKQRQRRPSLAAKLRAAQRAGAEGATIALDGSVAVAFVEAASTNGDDTRNPWDEVLTNAAD